MATAPSLMSQPPPFKQKSLEEIEITEGAGLGVRRPGPIG
jgi:hypothetical protein